MYKNRLCSSYRSHQFCATIAFLYKQQLGEKSKQTSMLNANDSTKLISHILHTNYMQKKIVESVLFFILPSCAPLCALQWKLALLKILFHRIYSSVYLACIFRSIVYLYGICVCTLSMETSSAQPHAARTWTSKRALFCACIYTSFSSLFSLFAINFLLFPLLVLTCMFYRIVCAKCTYAWSSRNEWNVIEW